jgi:hypothetical protein
VKERTLTTRIILAAGMSPLRPGSGASTFASSTNSTETTTQAEDNRNRSTFTRMGDAQICRDKSTPLHGPGGNYTMLPEPGSCDPGENAALSGVYPVPEHSYIFRHMRRVHFDDNATVYKCTMENHKAPLIFRTLNLAYFALCIDRKTY